MPSSVLIPTARVLVVDPNQSPPPDSYYPAMRAGNRWLVACQASAILCIVSGLILKLSWLGWVPVAILAMTFVTSFGDSNEKRAKVVDELQNQRTCVVWKLILTYG